MTHSILSMLPDEVRALHFEEEVNQLSKCLAVEQKKAEVVSLLNLMYDLRDLAPSVAPRSAAPSKASRASSPRIYRAQPLRTRR